jgi:hypothetical protein
MRSPPRWLRTRRARYTRAVARRRGRRIITLVTLARVLYSSMMRPRVKRWRAVRSCRERRPVPGITLQRSGDGVGNLQENWSPVHCLESIEDNIDL